MHLGLTQLGDDLLATESFPWHAVLSSEMAQDINLHPGQISGGRSSWCTCSRSHDLFLSFVSTDVLVC